LLSVGGKPFSDHQQKSSAEKINARLDARYLPFASGCRQSGPVLTGKSSVIDSQAAARGPLVANTAPSVKRTLALPLDKIRLRSDARGTEVRGTAAVEASVRGAGRPANT
jgi:hypothetical protein